MSRERYLYLIEEFCKLSKLAEPSRIVQGGAVEFDDTVFSLLYSEKINPAALLAYCEFGAPPAGQDAEALRLLLQKNLRSYDGDGGTVYSMSAAGKILAARRLLLPDANAQQLHDLLSDLANKAKLWRKDFRMGTQTAKAPPPQPRPARIQLAWSLHTPDSSSRSPLANQDMSDKEVSTKPAIARQGDAEIAVKRVRHGTGTPPVKLSELEEEHESRARADATSGKLHETPGGVRLRASLSSEIIKPALPE